MIVVKISGHELDSAEFVARFAATVRDLLDAAVIVHGGGKEISALQKRLGITPQYVDGVRVTDAESLALVEMVLCGTVNKRLVRAFVDAGVNAIGVSGVDGGMITARQMPHPTVDMGFTGEIVGVRADVVTRLLEARLLPVIAPICMGAGSSYNVNADHVAGALAGALDADRLVFLSNVPGVLIDQQVAPTLTPADAERLIADGVIFGGMIPKVRTALAALESGVAQAVITNLNGLQSNGGTVFTQA